MFPFSILLPTISFFLHCPSVCTIVAKLSQPSPFCTYNLAASCCWRKSRFCGCGIQILFHLSWALPSAQQDNVVLIHPSTASAHSLLSSCGTSSPFLNSQPHLSSSSSDNLSVSQNHLSALPNQQSHLFL